MVYIRVSSVSSSKHSTKLDDNVINIIINKLDYIRRNSRGIRNKVLKIISLRYIAEKGKQYLNQSSAYPISHYYI